jgi:energy-coupling factor transporter ATP-binding protein EcfA2
MIIETQNLTKTFGENAAVNGISLCVPEGATVALIGANGAGKTTTLRMLMNLLEADAVEARVLGVDSRRLTAREYSRIGYVSEKQARCGAGCSSNNSPDLSAGRAQRDPDPDLVVPAGTAKASKPPRPTPANTSAGDQRQQPFGSEETIDQRGDRG